MVELIECGAVNNSKKAHSHWKNGSHLCFLAQRIYDLIDDNPAFELLPVDYVNDPAVIAQHPNFCFHQCRAGSGFLWAGLRRIHRYQTCFGQRRPGGLCPRARRSRPAV